MYGPLVATYNFGSVYMQRSKKAHSKCVSSCSKKAPTQSKDINPGLTRSGRKVWKMKKKSGLGKVKEFYFQLEIK